VPLAPAAGATDNDEPLLLPWRQQEFSVVAEPSVERDRAAGRWSTQPWL